MSNRRTLLVAVPSCLAGLVVGLMLERPAPGQVLPAPSTAAGRFQISAWAHAGTSSAAGAVLIQAAQGVYVLDTQSGKLWQTQNAGELRPAGQAK